MSRLTKPEIQFHSSFSFISKEKSTREHFHSLAAERLTISTMNYCYYHRECSGSIQYKRRATDRPSVRIVDMKFVIKVNKQWKMKDSCNYWIFFLSPTTFPGKRCCYWILLSECNAIVNERVGVWFDERRIQQNVIVIDKWSIFRSLDFGMAIKIYVIASDRIVYQCM